MAMTKEEVSDLRSHIEMIVQREKEMQDASAALGESRRNLESFLHYQMFPEQRKP